MATQPCLLGILLLVIIIVVGEEIQDIEFELEANKVIETITKRGKTSSNPSSHLKDLGKVDDATWDTYYKQMDRKLKVEDWKLNDERVEDYYPKKLKTKIQNDGAITDIDAAKFENEFGRLKNRSGTTVFDLVKIINKGNDLDLEEADIKRKAPNFNYRKYINEFFEKENERVRILTKKKGRITMEEMLGKKREKTLNDELMKRKDLLLTDDEAWEARKRDARRDRVYLWQDRIVPFQIDPVLADSSSLIESAMSEIQAKTCIKFVQKSTKHLNWVQFVKKPGCWSSVGKEFWLQGSQEISLGSNCLYKGIIMHEIMHALGFFHEQSRPDRDEYVEIFWDNIEPGESHNFKKYGHDLADVLKSPYDYSSIMHYGKYSFALNDRNPTILSVKDKSASYGQRNQLSKTDIFQINELYDCQYEGHGWSRWSSFSPCNVDCNKERSRYCRERKNGKITCVKPKSNVLIRWGVDLDKVKCTANECYASVNGNWNRWGAWDKCSVTCDNGKQMRTRKCDDPKPRNGGKMCQGENTQTKECRCRSCNSGIYDCTFDADQDPYCVWKRDVKGDFQWQRHKGNTPSSATGPSADHTSGSGFYLFIESSGPSKQGWKARITSPSISPKQRCMTFSYHMYGMTTGTLRVYADDDSTKIRNMVFEKKGNQLNEWHTQQIELNLASSSKIIIEAERGNGFQGDIAIDDIVFQTGSCSGKRTSTTVQPTVETVKRVGCYHDYGFVNGKRPFSKRKNFRQNIVWSDYMNSLKDVVLKCAAFARKHQYQYFAIQYWGECWTGSLNEINYGRDGESTGCFPPTTDGRGTYIVGMEFANMVYRWQK